MVIGEGSPLSPITFHFSPFTSRVPALASPRRSANHAAEIHSSKGGIFVGQNICFYVPKRRLWLVLNPVIERLDDILFEMRGARVRFYNRLTLSSSILGVSKTEHVHFDPGGYQGDHRVHVLRDPRSRVQSNRSPDGIDLR